MIIHGRRCEHEGQLHVTRPGGLYLHVFTCIYMTCIYISYLRGSYSQCVYDYASRAPGPIVLLFSISEAILVEAILDIAVAGAWYYM